MIFEISSTATNSLSTAIIILVVLVAVTLLLLGRLEAAVLVILTFPLHVVSNFPKAIVERPRPSPAFEGIEGVAGFQSFPSGHAEFVITFYGFLAYLLMLRLEYAWQRWLLLASWLVFVLATGFGRIAEGRHWPLDILYGYVIGLGMLSGLIWLDSSLRKAQASIEATPADEAADRPVGPGLTSNSPEFSDGSARELGT